MKLAFARLLLWLMSWMPLWLIRGLSGLVGGLAVMLPWRRRRTLEANLERAWPGLGRRDRRRLLRRNLMAMAATVLECGPLWHRSRRWVERRIVAVEGLELLEAARRDGRGVLMVGGHLGQWELSILYGSLNLPIAYLYKPPRSSKADALLTARRSRFGAEMIPTGGAALRSALRCLQSGRVLGLLFDQLPRAGESVQAPFFGRPVATMTLPYGLIQRTGCRVLMGHCLRVRGGWKIVFDAVPEAEDADPQRAAAALNRALEAAVRRAPEQYLWHYKRFDALAE